MIAPSFYAFHQAGLSTIMPFNYTGPVLIGIGAVFIVVGAAIGPETRGADLHATPAGG